MSPSARAAASAKRAVADGTIAVDEHRLSFSALMKQAAAVVILSMLGVVVIGAVNTASAPYATAVSTERTAINGAPDVTRAQPVQAAADTQEATEQAAPVDAVDLSKNALRAELSSAVAGELSDARDQALQQTSEQVGDAVQTANADRRAEALNNSTTQIITTSQALEAQRAAKEAASRLKGTLVRSNGAPALSEQTLAALRGLDDGLPWVTPMAPGSYIRSAGFGEYGSWSRYHTGQDMSAAYGTPIRAVASGMVMQSNGGAWAGTHVVIMHSDGGQTLYAHMSKRVVAPGQLVKTGQIIGYVGLSGRTFGSHLHFEYYPVGAEIGDVYTAKNPVAYLAKHGVGI